MILIKTKYCKDCGKEIKGYYAIRCNSCSNKNERHPSWKGDKVGIRALHIWIKKNKIKPKFCECCKKVQPYDLANISGKYKRDVSDFEWLCRKCHMTKDGRLKILEKTQYRKIEKTYGGEI